jgi:hypothetical protein
VPPEIYLLRPKKTIYIMECIYGAIRKKNWGHCPQPQPAYGGAYKYRRRRQGYAQPPPPKPLLDEKIF